MTRFRQMPALLVVLLLGLCAALLVGCATPINLPLGDDQGSGSLLDAGTSADGASTKKDGNMSWPDAGASGDAAGDAVVGDGPGDATLDAVPDATLDATADATFDTTTQGDAVSTPDQAGSQ